MPGVLNILWNAALQVGHKARVEEFFTVLQILECIPQSIKICAILKNLVLPTLALLPDLEILPDLFHHLAAKFTQEGRRACFFFLATAF